MLKNHSLLYLNSMIDYKITNKLSGEVLVPTGWTTDESFEEFTCPSATIRFEKPSQLIDQNHFENETYTAEYVQPSPEVIAERIANYKEPEVQGANPNDLPVA